MAQLHDMNKKDDNDYVLKGQSTEVIVSVNTRKMGRLEKFRTIVKVRPQRG